MCRKYVITDTLYNTGERKLTTHFILPICRGCWTTVASMMASGAAHLSSSKLNLGLLRDFYRREFLECIDRCLGTKVISGHVYLLAPMVHFAAMVYFSFFLKCKTIRSHDQILFQSCCNKKCNIDLVVNIAIRCNIPKLTPVCVCVFNCLKTVKI